MPSREQALGPGEIGGGVQGVFVVQPAQHGPRCGRLGGFQERGQGEHSIGSERLVDRAIDQAFEEPAGRVGMGRPQGFGFSQTARGAEASQAKTVELGQGEYVLGEEIALSAFEDAAANFGFLIVSERNNKPTELHWTFASRDEEKIHPENSKL